MAKTINNTRLIEETARAYLQFYVQGLRSGSDNISFVDFSSSPLAKSLEALAVEQSVAPEVLLRKVDPSVFGHRAQTFSEALHLSFAKRQAILDAQVSKLSDFGSLQSSFKDILADSRFTESQKIMLIALLSTGKATVEDFERISGTLGPYLKSSDIGAGISSDELLDRIDPALFERYPAIFNMLVQTSFNGLVKEHGYFTSVDHRLDYFGERIDDARRLQTKFDSGSAMHKVYDAVVKLFEDLGTLVVPGARERIRNPALKVPGLDDIVERIDVKRTYSRAEFEKLFGASIYEFWNDGKRVLASAINEDRSVDGRRAFDALTVEFPSLHQLIGINEILKKKRVLIADQMGTGKTAQAVLSVPAIADYLSRDVRALVVCPYGMKQEWNHRIGMYLSSDSSYRDSVVINSHEDVDKIGDARFVVVNYEKLMRSKWSADDVKNYIEENSDDSEFSAKVDSALKEFADTSFEQTVDIASTVAGIPDLKVRSKLDAVKYWVAGNDVRDARKIVTRLNEVGFDVVISDESDLARNPSADRSKAMIDLALNSEYYIELTGTPVPNSERDLAKSVHLLFGNSANGKFVPTYTVESFESEFKHNPVFLNAVLTPRMLRRTLKESAVDLSDLKLIEHRVPVSFDGFENQREAYIAVLNDRSLSTSEQLLLLRRLSVDPQLVASHYSGEPISAKYSKLFEFLDEDKRMGRQSVVFSVYRDGVTRRDNLSPKGEILIEQLARKFDGVRFVDGQVPDGERQKIVDGFKSGDSQVLLLTAQSMGRGCDLSSASRVYHLDTTYLPDEYDQQNARLFRRGQDSHVHAYKFVISDNGILIPRNNDELIAGSVDEGVERLHERRRALSDMFLLGATGWTVEHLKEMVDSVKPMKRYLGNGK